MDVACDNCSEIFNRPRNKYNEAVKNGWNQFCQPKCQSEFKNKKVSKNCTNCLEPILVERRTIKKSKTGNFFCGKSCAAKYNNKKRKHSQETKEKISSSLENYYKPLKLYGFCPCCGEEYSYKPSKVNQFCSENCRYDCLELSLNKEEVINFLVNFMIVNKKIPVRRDVGARVNRAAKKHFGSWKKAVAEAHWEYSFSDNNTVG